MAECTELMEGRSGYSLGIGGWEGLKREFHVVVDSPNDFPEVIMQIPSLITEGTAVPWGSPYPGDGSGLIVVLIERMKRLTHTDYLMRAVYGPPLVIENPRDIVDHWQWDTDGGLQFERTFFDLDRVPIASPRYEPVSDDTENSEQLFYTNHNGQIVALRRKPNEFEPLQGADRPVKRATLNGFRKVLKLRSGTTGYIIGQLGTVNSRPFQGAERGALRFFRVSIRPVGGMLGPFTGIIINPGELRHHEVTIGFEWNPDLHEPYRQVHVRTWDDGSFSVIYDGNEPEAPLVESRHRLHLFADFRDAILTPFE